MGLTRISGDVIQTPLNVGVVTATGVNVGTAVTIYTGGFRVGSSDLHSSGLTVQNLNSTGVSTFTTLKVGTGVTISAGVITATSFKGDGSQLTGITQTTINNNANNRIITGSATANTLEAESNLTYDGTTLAVGAGGNITVGSAFIKNNSVGLGTTSTTGRNAGVGTAVGTMVYNSTTDALEVYTQSNAWITASPFAFSATGGTESTSSRPGYKVHTFTSPGTFTVSGAPKSCEILLVAGGGGGGCQHGGGGGGGGYRSLSALTFSPGPYTVQAGGGGSGGSSPPAGNTYLNGTLAARGTPSFISGPGISSVTATGGGGGGSYANPAVEPGAPVGADGSSGGSGGGGAGWNPGTTALGGTGNSGGTDPRSSPTSEGNNGGNGGYTGGNHVGGGGGGAGSVGNTGSSPGGPPTSNTGGGNGGSGLASSINGTPTTRGGGGGGGNAGPYGYGGTGGPGGGGAGGTPAVAPGAGTPGTTNTGGGGGAAGGAGLTTGNGGSGIVIIAYPTA